MNKKKHGTLILIAAATGVYTVASKKAVRTDKKRLKKAVPWVCPECGAPAKPNSLCAHCGEPFTRLWDTVLSDAGRPLTG